MTRNAVPPTALLAAALFLTPAGPPAAAQFELMPDHYCDNAVPPTTPTPGCRVIKERFCFRADGAAGPVNPGTPEVVACAELKNINCDQHNSQSATGQYPVEWEDTITFSGDAEAEASFFSLAQATLKTGIGWSSSHAFSVIITISPNSSPCRTTTGRATFSVQNAKKYEVDFTLYQSYEITTAGDSGQACVWQGQNIHNGNPDNDVIVVECGSGTLYGEGNVLESTAQVTYDSRPVTSTECEGGCTPGGTPNYGGGD